jgi:hypothetical protein
MLPRITDARYIADHTIWLRFADGVEGEVDLSRELEGEVFEPLKDEEYFKSFRLHPELKTLVWPNGADFAPEFLRATVRIAA